jgi:hypothetical protein
MRMISWGPFNLYLSAPPFPPFFSSPTEENEVSRVIGIFPETPSGGQVGRGDDRRSLADWAVADGQGSGKDLIPPRVNRRENIKTILNFKSQI